MNTITYHKLNSQKFDENALRFFVRHQEVTECLRKIDGEWRLIPVEFVEDWDDQQLHDKAKLITEKNRGDWFGYGAFDGETVVGYITVATQHFGSRQQYAELTLFHVSQPYRNQGIGKKLFALACSEAKQQQTQRLYISAHSSKESQAAYRKLGCTFAEEINAQLAEAEPCDVQMEYVI